MTMLEKIEARLLGWGYEVVEADTFALEFLIPNYVKEGKNQLVVSIGCTGGRHRSVALAEAIYERLKGSTDYGLKVEHRDMDRDLVRKRTDYEVK